MNFIAKGRQKRIIVKYKWGDKMQKNTFNIGCIFLRCVLCALFALTEISAHAADTCSILDNSQCTSSTNEYSNNIFCQMGNSRCVDFGGAILRTEDCNFCQEGYRLSSVDCDNGSFSTCISCVSVDNSKYCPGSEYYGAIDCPENGNCSKGIFTGCKQGYKWYADRWNTSSCTECESDEYCPGGKSGAFTCPDEDRIILGSQNGKIEQHSTINQAGCYKPEGSNDYPGYLKYSFNNTDYSIQYCNACLPGYYDDGTNADIIIQSAMQFSNGDLVCPVTKYKALNCVRCGDGEYCPGYLGDATYDKNTNYTCPEGYFCEKGERFPCDKDQFCPEGSSKPQDCPTGSVCNGFTISGCEPSYYWADKGNQGSTTTPCEPCTVGHYCPGGSGSDAKQIQCAEAEAPDGSGSVPCCLRDLLSAPIYIGRNVLNETCPAEEIDFDCPDEFPIFGISNAINPTYYICSACDSGYVCNEYGVNTGCTSGYYDNDTSDEVVNCVPCNDASNRVTIQGNPYYKNGAYCTNSERHLCSSELSEYSDMKDEFYASDEDAKLRSECFVHFETGKNYADKDGVFTVSQEQIISIEQCK